MPLLFWPPSQLFKASKPRLEPREMVGTWESSAVNVLAAPAAAAAASAEKDPSFDWDPGVRCCAPLRSPTVLLNHSLACAVSFQEKRFLFNICGRRRPSFAGQFGQSLQVRIASIVSSSFCRRVSLIPRAQSNRALVV